jgi:hypothetical protein
MGSWGAVSHFNGFETSLVARVNERVRHAQPQSTRGRNSKLHQIAYPQGQSWVDELPWIALDEYTHTEIFGAWGSSMRMEHARILWSSRAQGIRFFFFFTFPSQMCFHGQGTLVLSKTSVAGIPKLGRGWALMWTNHAARGVEKGGLSIISRPVTGGAQELISKDTAWYIRTFVLSSTSF